jgi:hypothetical protein
MAYGTSPKTESRPLGRIWESVSHDRTLHECFPALRVSFDATYYRYVLAVSLFPLDVLPRAGQRLRSPGEMRAIGRYPAMQGNFAKAGIEKHRPIY